MSTEEKKRTARIFLEIEIMNDNPLNNKVKINIYGTEQDLEYLVAIAMNRDDDLHTIIDKGSTTFHQGKKLADSLAGIFAPDIDKKEN